MDDPQGRVHQRIGCVRWAFPGFRVAHRGDVVANVFQAALEIGERFRQSRKDRKVEMDKR